MTEAQVVCAALVVLLPDVPETPGEGRGVDRDIGSIGLMSSSMPVGALTWCR